MLHEDIYKILSGITTNVKYKTIPDNYNFSDLLIVYIINKQKNKIFPSDEIYNMKIKIFSKDEETCITYEKEIIDKVTLFKNSTIRKIDFNFTTNIYDDLLDINSYILDMTITNDLE